MITVLRTESSTLAQLEREDRIDFIGGVYNVAAGQVEWLVEPTVGTQSPEQTTRI